MLKERRLAANMVAEKLFAAEAAIDAAVTAAAELAAVMPSARIEGRIAAAAGQDALLAAIATVQQLADARSQIVATHKALRQAQTDVGLGQVMFNDWNCPPPPKGQVEDQTAAPRRHLTVAA
jgi:hypothetical protein